MTLGPVKVMGAGVVVMLCVEEVNLQITMTHICMKNIGLYFRPPPDFKSAKLNTAKFFAIYIYGILKFYYVP